MDREKKSISRSIRMTPTVYSIVDKFKGNGFNEKFENLVLYCLKKEKEIKAAIKKQQESYDCQRRRNLAELDRLDKEIENKRKVIVNLDSLIQKVTELETFINQITTGDK